MKQRVRLDHHSHSIEIEVVEVGSECWSVRVTVSSKNGLNVLTIDCTPTLRFTSSQRAAWFAERSAKRWIDNQSSATQ